MQRRLGKGWGSSAESAERAHMEDTNRDEASDIHCTNA